MRRKIVITGISSSLVQKLVRQIDPSKFELVGISRNPTVVSLDNVRIVKGDIRNFKEIASVLEGCYMIIHGAAVTHSRREKDYFETNLHATRQIVQAAKDHQVSRFVLISSNTAGTDSGAYGLTKLQAEQHIEQEMDNWSIFRLSEVYGGGKKEGIEKLIQDLLTKSIVLCPSNIPSKLCPIHVDDAARLLFSYIFADDNVNGMRVISGPEAFSYREIIRETARIAKKNVRIFSIPRKFMFFVKWLTQVSPLPVGIVPDQVDRLYAVKHIEPNPDSQLKLESYIEKLVTIKNKS